MVSLGREVNVDESIAEGIGRKCYEETSYRIKVDFAKSIYRKIKFLLL